MELLTKEKIQLLEYENTPDELIPPRMIEQINDQWLVDFGDENIRIWDGWTGPVVRTKRQWINWAVDFVGFNCAEINDLSSEAVEDSYNELTSWVAQEAQNKLIPNIKNPDNSKKRQKRLIFNAGSRATGDYINEYHRIKAGKRAPHFDIWTGARAGFYAEKGDMVVGRGLVETIGEADPEIQYVEIQNYNERYYTYDALAQWAEDDPYFNNPSNPIVPIVNFLNENPEVSISLYANGFEEQIVLLYLLSLTNNKTLNIEANSPLVDSLNNKAILHPEIDEVLEVEVEDLNSSEEILNTLRREKLSSQIAQYFGEEILDIFLGVPGCTISKTEDLEEYEKKFRRLYDYFYNRYGITKIVAKPAVSCDGEGIIFNIDPRETETLDKLARELFNHKTYIFEPQINFNKYEINGEYRDIVPSVHIKDGYTLVGLGTNQKIYDEGVWGGHDLLDKVNAEKLGLSEMFEKMEKYMTIIASKSREKNLGLSLAGIDFYEGTVESDNPIIASRIWSGPGDPNIRLTGAAYIYASFDKVVEEIENHYGTKLIPGDVSVSTRVITPNADYQTIDMLVQKFKEENGNLDVKITFGTVAACKGGWGMIYASGENTNTACKYAEKLVEFLESNNILI
ncbi:hypothetical protein GF362_00445 [Candidatus Dojkabacteria bacterium]|nr:hypothetical protein [Candidatus Dojkabacteria bacterium]